MIQAAELRDTLDFIISKYGDVPVLIPNEDDHSALKGIDMEEYTDPETGENILYIVTLHTKEMPE